ncbi:MAG: ABC-2 family transporter protein, partial [Gemmatimonadota bacterium]|nr:ABC-2 family transporter protein [Gemmatimonadota bacterium]MDE2953615.1 ABC-2 family transporter protein [Gemmatimonadota bacterium]
MTNALRLYMHYLSQSVRSQMQYRASFIMLSFGHFLTTGVEFLAIASLFARFKHIQGWALPEVAFLYGLINISFAFADAASRGFDIFGTMVKSGDFDRL